MERGKDDKEEGVKKDVVEGVVSAALIWNQEGSECGHFGHESSNGRERVE